MGNEECDADILLSAALEELEQLREWKAAALQTMHELDASMCELDAARASLVRERNELFNVVSDLCYIGKQDVRAFVALREHARQVLDAGYAPPATPPER